MVRIWDVPVEDLDDQHLLGEHLQLHIIWNALTQQTQPPPPGGRSAAGATTRRGGASMTVSARAARARIGTRARWRRWSAAPAGRAPASGHPSPKSGCGRTGKTW